MQGIQPTPEELKGYKKTSRQAQTAAFMCLLVYFTVKICTILIFYSWKNYLWGRPEKIVIFVLLLVINGYFMLTTGRKPGFYDRKIGEKQRVLIASHQEILENQKKPEAIQKFSQQSCIPYTREQEKESLNVQSISDSVPVSSDKNLESVLEIFQNFCKLCQCMKRNRMKHCYSCGRCVMKFDHHCPWIGSCVGQLNHGKFVLSLIAHTIQASFTLYICLNSLEFYKYYDEDTQTFSTQYGVLILWSLFMAMYILFAGGLFLFHSYLIASNVTTRQLVSRRKCVYLKNIKGNPFDEGMIKNFIYAFNPDENGREWVVLQKQENQRAWYQKLFKNSVYECC